ncbi:MAG: histidine kinase [Chloroflexi bacterium]|jgi:hypothetical protein|nr:histidine kinase [Chloroflexota bacterium]MBT3670975.1 histidine kinase [Chloroflexota bacterium]MBT4004160.1 histidine kinase [Chloroflexota bacterium]MBT4306311.1 histidine kinase [Chloroflexota bacterium]MBT4532808.1 histidine kinase [Chloroflexota bacterium]
MKQERKIEELKQKIKTLKNQLPKHSISPSMLIKIEELEEELEKLIEGEKDI